MNDNALTCAHVVEGCTHQQCGAGAYHVGKTSEQEERAQPQPYTPPRRTLVTEQAVTASARFAAHVPPSP